LVVKKKTSFSLSGIHIEFKKTKVRL